MAKFGRHFAGADIPESYRDWIEPAAAARGGRKRRQCGEPRLADIRVRAAGAIDGRIIRARGRATRNASDRERFCHGNASTGALRRAGGLPRPVSARTVMT